ncbi:MAG: glucosamine-6-phosphate deaminase [Chitinophagaceae bacterium]
MEIHIAKDPEQLGKQSGEAAATFIRDAIKTNGFATIILATGASQFATLNTLIEEDIDWSKVTMFHLDEYIGLPVTHPASFRKYLAERFIEKVPALKSAHLINGENDPVIECKRVGDLIQQHAIDVALVGIGENGHLAFNDPPADFDTEEPYIVVQLDEACRKQQLGEGWFASLNEVPQQAISMSIKQIMKSRQIICSVPDSRKAVAVRNTLENAVSNIFPASILQRHSRCSLYIDENSASLLSKRIKVLSIFNNKNGR